MITPTHSRFANCEPIPRHIEVLGNFLIAHHRTGWHIYSNNHVEQYYDKHGPNITAKDSIDGKTHTLIL